METLLNIFIWGAILAPVIFHVYLFLVEKLSFWNLFSSLLGYAPSLYFVFLILLAMGLGGVQNVPDIGLQIWLLVAYVFLFFVPYIALAVFVHKHRENVNVFSSFLIVFVTSLVSSGLLTLSVFIMEEVLGII